MIRVIQFTVAASQGGRTQYILNLWNKIDHSRFLFDFVTFSKKLDFEERLEQDGCKVYHVENYPEKNRDAFIMEFSEILRNGYDAIEIHTSYWKDTIVEELADRFKVRKIIIHGHSTGITQITADNKDEEKRLIYEHNEVKKRLGSAMATDFLACSNECADWLFRPQIPNDRIRILPNTIDSHRFKYDEEVRHRVRKELGLDGCFVLGFVGRLEPVKNLEFLLDVFYMSNKNHDSIKLLIVGDGSEKGLLEGNVKERSIGDAVIFTGRRSNTECYYQAMDVFLLPSHFEGFPLSILEAECSGLKCIVSTNVPKTVDVTGNVIRLPIDDAMMWVDEIMKISSGYERADCSEVLKRKGFDTMIQIKTIENLYSS